jgi:hypothetical protein
MEKEKKEENCDRMNQPSPRLRSGMRDLQDGREGEGQFLEQKGAKDAKGEAKRRFYHGGTEEE